MSTADLPKTLGHLHSNGEFCLHYSPAPKEWPLDVVSLEEARAYGDKRAREAVPEGWKLVPVEPTEEMLTAAHEADREYTLRTFGDVMTVLQGPHDHYVAMLAASPSPDMLEKRNDVA